MRAICLLLISVVSHDGNVQNRMGKLFQEFEHRYTGDEYQNEPFKYRLFVPPVEGRLPILLWLHGAGEYGRDNLRHLRWLDRIFLDPNKPEKYPFFVLAVQYPRENPMWFRSSRDWARKIGKSPQDDMGEVAVDILRSVMKKYPIDADRVYMSGVSDGGYACWEIAGRYPELFAAVVPMAAGPPGDMDLTKLQMPIWAFNNKNDYLSSVEWIQRAVDEINYRGGNALLTADEGYVHDCWTAAFLNHQVMDWMLAQRRGSLRWGWLTENAWMVALEIGVVALIILGIRQEWSRRHRGSEVTDEA